MTDLQKIVYAKSFIDKLANGINPLNDTPIPEGDVAKNVRLSKCFFYVSEILSQVIENGGVQTKKVKKRSKTGFTLNDEDRRRLKVSETSMSVSEIANYLNSFVDLENTHKITASKINNWLLSLQLLEIIVNQNGKNQILPTDQGRELGIFTEERIGQYGRYLSVLYAQSAQQFIFDNIEAIVGHIKEKDEKTSEFQGKAWTHEQDRYLTDLFRNNCTVSDIALKMKRSEGGIRARLKRLGLIENRFDAK